MNGIGRGWGTSNWGEESQHSGGWGQSSSSSYQTQHPVALHHDSKKRKKETSGWGESEDWGQSHSASDWSTVVAPTFISQIHPTQLSSASHGYVVDAAKDGPLSTGQTREDAKATEKMLGIMLSNMEANLGEINKIIHKFIADMLNANRIIFDYCNSIIQKKESISKPEVEQANAIVLFCKNGVVTLNETSHLALDLINKGSGILTHQTQAAIQIIFETRMNQVKLFSEKVNVLYKQEEHELKTMLHIQEIKLKEQQQLFSQLKEIVQIDESKRDAASRREIEQKKIDLEHAIQVRSLELKQEEQQQKHELEVAKQQIEAKQKETETANKKFLDEKIADQTHLSDMHRVDNEKELGMHQANMEAETRRHEADLKSQTEQHKVDVEGKVAVTQAVTSVLKPSSSCIVM